MTQPGSGNAVLLQSDHGIVETRYSCVVLRSWDSEQLTATAPVDNTLVTVPDLEEGEGELWVNTADQWGPFSVTTRLWSTRPVDPGPEWEDVVELSVTSSTGGWTTWRPTGPTSSPSPTMPRSASRGDRGVPPVQPAAA
jgi:hypothetical protein